MNFAPLIQQRLRVYRVVFEPRRLPFYPVYILALGGMLIMQSRHGLPAARPGAWPASSTTSAT